MKLIIAIQFACFVGVVVGIVYLVSALHEFGLEGLGKSVGTMVRAFNETVEAQ